MAENVRIENHKICSECGGKCCKFSGCICSPFDFFSTSNGQFDIQRLIDGINEGKYIIVYDIDEKKGSFYYVRSREVADGDLIISLYQCFHSPCALLTDEGCPFSLDERPFGGASLVPSYAGCRMEKISNNELSHQWDDYQTELLGIIRGFNPDSNSEYEILENEAKIQVSHLIEYYNKHRDEESYRDALTLIKVFKLDDVYLHYIDYIKNRSGCAINLFECGLKTLRNLIRQKH